MTFLKFYLSFILLSSTELKKNVPLSLIINRLHNYKTLQRRFSIGHLEWMNFHEAIFDLIHTYGL